MDRITEQAKTALGQAQPGDYGLRLNDQSVKLPATAAPLARVLQSSELAEIRERHEKHDRIANRAEARQKRLARVAAYGLASPALFGAVLLFPDLPLEGDLPYLGDRIVLAVLALQALALLLALFALLSLARRRRVEASLRARGVAEEARVELFEAVVQAREPSGAEELAYEPLALEYVRRYQLDVQRAYFAGVAEHAQRRAGLGPVKLWIALLFFAAATPVGFAIHGVMNEAASPIDALAERVIAALALVGGGFAAARLATTLGGDYPRKAAKYAVMVDNLNWMAARPLSEARRAAAEGDRRQVYRFVADLHRIIASEPREWVPAWERSRRLEDEAGPSGSGGGGGERLTKTRRRVGAGASGPVLTLGPDDLARGER